MARHYKARQEYYEEFDPERLAAQIKAQAAEAAAQAEQSDQADNAGEDGVDKQ